MAGQNYTQDCRRLAPWPARKTTPPSSLARVVRTSGPRARRRRPPFRSFVGGMGDRSRSTDPPFVRHAFAFALPLSFFLNALRQSFATAAVMIHDVFFASATRVCVLRR